MCFATLRLPVESNFCLEGRIHTRLIAVNHKSFLANSKEARETHRRNKEAPKETHDLFDWGSWRREQLSQVYSLSASSPVLFF